MDLCCKKIGALDTRLSTQIADLRTEQRTDIAGACAPAG